MLSLINTQRTITSTFDFQANLGNLMKLINVIKEIIDNFLPINTQNLWVEVTTESPCCTYYFGPFQNYQEAEIMYPGYIEDLEMEGAEQIKASIKRCRPEKLTVCDEI